MVVDIYTKDGTIYEKVNFGEHSTLPQIRKWLNSVEVFITIDDKFIINKNEIRKIKLSEI